LPPEDGCRIAQEAKQKALREMAHPVWIRKSNGTLIEAFFLLSGEKYKLFCLDAFPNEFELCMYMLSLVKIFLD